MNLENIILSDRRQTQKATCYMIYLYEASRNSPSYREKKQTNGYQGLGREEKWGMAA